LGQAADRAPRGRVRLSCERFKNVRQQVRLGRQSDISTVFAGGCLPGGGASPRWPFVGLFTVNGKDASATQ